MLPERDAIGMENVRADNKPVYGFVNHALGLNDFALYEDRAWGRPPCWTAQP